MIKQKKIKKVILKVIFLLIVFHVIFEAADLIYQSKYPKKYSEDISAILSETPGWECNDNYNCTYQSEEFMIGAGGSSFGMIIHDYTGSYYLYSYNHSTNTVNPQTQNTIWITIDTCSFNILGFLDCEEEKYRITYKDQMLLRKMKRIIDDALDDYTINRWG